MQSKQRLILFAAVLTVVFGCLTIATPLFAASSEKTLYRFCALKDCTDGDLPNGALIFDAAGNLYGTTDFGGTTGNGTVFELVHGASGWTENVLYNFCSTSKCSDGYPPRAGLIFDAAGNLYGTTEFGGTYGNGTVFELAHGTSGWAETVLYSFGESENDGILPISGLIFDAAGNLYGTTVYGGTYGVGTVFQLAPGANGTWTETVLYSFSNKNKVGYSPVAGVIFDAAGNLYGTTTTGGGHASGTVYELTPGDNGTWTEKVLHRFNRVHEVPLAGLIFDAAGNLYGTTCMSSAHNYGAVFQLTPGTNGNWTERVLHDFNRLNGACPHSGVIFDAAGNLYGATSNGGPHSSGTVFELSPGTNGKWTEKILYGFGNAKNGMLPYGGLILDAAGNLYGTTLGGGRNNQACGSSGCGVAFEITP